MELGVSDIIAIILSVMNSILIPLVSVLIKKYKQNRNDMALEKKGTQALLRNELLSLSRIYIKNGYVVVREEYYNYSYQHYNFDIIHRLMRNNQFVLTKELHCIF